MVKTLISQFFRENDIGGSGYTGWFFIEFWYIIIMPFGGQSEVDPPVPVPNTEVKRLSADDTWGGTPWENMPLPGGFIFYPPGDRFI